MGKQWSYLKRTAQRGATWLYSKASWKPSGMPCAELTSECLEE